MQFSRAKFTSMSFRKKNMEQTNTKQGPLMSLFLETC